MTVIRWIRHRKIRHQAIGFSRNVRRPRAKSPTPPRRRLAFETLEKRTLLAADMASIAGVAFQDLDNDGVYEPLAGDVGLAGATIQLTGTNDLGPIATTTTTTASDGSYSFSNLRAGSYEVSQLWPAPVGYFLTGASPVNVVITAADAAGVEYSPIDSFHGVEQLLTASAPAGTPVASSVTDAASIGGTRDMFADVTSATGVVSLNSNAVFLPGVLEINPGSSSVGRYLVTWDGGLNPSVLNPTGLQVLGVGEDLTSGGASTGIRLVLGVDKPGEFATLRVYSDAANWSQAIIALPDTGGSPDGEVLILFDGGFTVGAGGGADFENVGAIQLEINASIAAMDGQFDLIGAVGPSVLAADFANLQAAPAIHIEKTTNGQDADTPAGAYLSPGATAVFTYTVTNTGNVPLASVAVTDDQGVTPGFVSGDTDGDDLLDLTETWTYSASTTVTAGQYANVGAVTANPVDTSGRDLPGLANVSDTDPSHHFGVIAGIQIEKSTNGEDADTGTGPLLEVGGAAAFEYVVTNSGNVPLADVAVSDNRGVAIAFVSGDVDGDDLLDTSETWTYRASATVTAGQYENTGSVTANPVDANGADIAGLANVSDTDPSHHFGVGSGIDLEKATNGQDADSGPGPTVYIGELATFTYVVTNTGNVPLTNVVVRDDNGTSGNAGDDFSPTFVSGDTDSDNVLDVGETWQYSATRVATAGQYVNSATVVASDTLEQSLTDEDLSHHLGLPRPRPFSKRMFLTRA